MIGKARNEYAVRSQQLKNVLENIRSRQTSVNNFFCDNSICRTNPTLVPIRKSRNKKVANTGTIAYTTMDIYLAGTLPKPRKTTVKVLMKMTHNASALVSNQSLEYHQDKVLNFRNMKRFQDNHFE